MNNEYELNVSKAPESMRDRPPALHPSGKDAWSRYRAQQSVSSNSGATSSRHMQFSQLPG